MQIKDTLMIFKTAENCYHYFIYQIWLQSNKVKLIQNTKFLLPDADLLVADIHLHIADHRHPITTVDVHVHDHTHRLVSIIDAQDPCLFKESNEYLWCESWLVMTRTRSFAPSVYRHLRTSISCFVFLMLAFRTSWIAI